MLLNLFDLFLTGWIFKHQGQEANGIAAWVLKVGHLSGFALYKFVMVVFIILICEAISIRRPRTAQILILGASALYVAVILWECYLIWLFIDHPTHAIKEGFMMLHMVAAPHLTALAPVVGHVTTFAGAVFSCGGMRG